MKYRMNREVALNHNVAKHYVIPEWRLKKLKKKGIVDFYFYDDQAQSDAVTVRLKKLKRKDSDNDGTKMHSKHKHGNKKRGLRSNT